jgi:hypothetical protein
MSGGSPAWQTRAPDVSALARQPATLQDDSASAASATATSCATCGSLLSANTQVCPTRWQPSSRRVAPCSACAHGAACLSPIHRKRLAAVRNVPCRHGQQLCPAVASCQPWAGSQSTGHLHLAPHAGCGAPRGLPARCAGAGRRDAGCNCTDGDARLRVLPDDSRRPAGMHESCRWEGCGVGASERGV